MIEVCPLLGSALDEAAWRNEPRGREGGDRINWTPVPGRTIINLLINYATRRPSLSLSLFLSKPWCSCLIADGHMINTKCSSSHNRRALCCKMSVEFDRFLDSGRKWVPISDSFSFFFFFFFLFFSLFGDEFFFSKVSGEKVNEIYFLVRLRRFLHGFFFVFIVEGFCIVLRKILILFFFTWNDFNLKEKRKWNVFNFNFCSLGMILI